MAANTVLLLLLSVLLAGGLSYFQYFFRARNRNKLQLLLSILRFLAIFGILLLLINPVVSRKTFETIKTPLVLAIDNSSSITDLKADKATVEMYDKFTGNAALKEKFDIQPYRFDSGFEAISTREAIDFKGRQTNIGEAAKNIKSINKNISFPTVLISDGNQTTGEDYVFGFDANNKVYPLIVGDTTTYLDLKVNQVNVNKYAFHKNKYPAEIFLQYAGNKSVNASFSIAQGNNILVKQNVAFSPAKKAQVVSVLLPADKVGVQVFTAKLTSGENEKNTYNNAKKFVVEVIDQKSEIALVSAISHPDLGALKRSIETNASRKVSIIKPNEISNLNKFNVLILYQPNATFKAVFDANKNLRTNHWIITGTSTDFNFLNQQQDAMVFRMSGQREDYLADFNADFNLFALDDIGFNGFPPLENPFGNVDVKSNLTVLLSSRIRNTPTDKPLLAFADKQGLRSAYLLGENSWKWRGHSFLDKKSFEAYDIFIDKTIQYLASNDSKKSLIVSHERFYNSGDAIEITAQYFNKNYELDEKARLTITVTNTKTKQQKKYDLLRDSNAFKVNLDGLGAGNYSFTVRELNSNAGYSSGFEILDFDIEKQFVNPDVAKLKQLATQTAAAAYVPNQADALIKVLLDNPDYKAVEKTIVKKTPLIDWIWLLVLIALALGGEWFIRKYNGLL